MMTLDTDAGNMVLLWDLNSDIIASIVVGDMVCMLLS